MLESNMVHILYLQPVGVTKFMCIYRLAIPFLKFELCSCVTVAHLEPLQNKLETSVGHVPKILLHWPRHLYGQLSWLHIVGFHTFPRTFGGWVSWVTCAFCWKLEWPWTCLPSQIQSLLAHRKLEHHWSLHTHMYRDSNLQTYPFIRITEVPWFHAYIYI